MADFIRAYIALGANLGDPLAQVRQSVVELGALPQTRLMQCSSFYLSAPVNAEGPDFVNAVAAVDTRLPASVLLQSLLDIENRHGRARDYRNAPRTLDLDLLLYDGLICSEPGLTLPHPRMHERMFVLLPLLEISPACRIPGRGRVGDWLERCRDQVLKRVDDDLAAVCQA
jgi:2-amino-4-hydroxy-6-hydroxymethyldihydropteridine diphosphokinase